jgi:hypothetical protein
MLKTYKSKIPYPSEVSEVSCEVVTTLEEENYFTEQFEDPEEAKTIFYDKFAGSLIKKFIDGHELMWSDEEFGKLIMQASVEQAVNELEKKDLVDVFEDELGEKIVVLKKKD